jgi:hypothetical protein
MNVNINQMFSLWVDNVLFLRPVIGIRLVRQQLTSPGAKCKALDVPMMAGQSEAPQVAGLGENRERRKSNGSRI